MAEPTATNEEFDRALLRTAQDVYQLHLYVSGASRRSVEAIANLKRMCEQYLPGRYDLEIIDLYQQPAMAAAEQLVVAPTLVKKSPLPVRKLIGTLADVNEVLRRLDIRRV